MSMPIPKLLSWFAVEAAVVPEAVADRAECAGQGVAAAGGGAGVVRRAGAPAHEAAQLAALSRIAGKLPCGITAVKNNAAIDG
jgi:hypothetical protein